MLKKWKRCCACLIALVLTMSHFSLNVIEVKAEENGFKNILIVVDAGHTSNYNVGCISGYNEGDWAYQQMLLDAEAYRKAGFTVITTRGQYENPGLVSRGQMAVQNAAGYSDVVFISNHSNATADGSSKATGVNACSSQYLSQKNTDLIYAMMTAVAEVMNTKTGVTYVRNEIFRKPLNSAGADWYGVIRGAVNGATSIAQAASGPVQYAFILEHGFHTNPLECAFLMDIENCSMMAKAKANALVKYFGDLYGIPYTLEEVIPAPTETVPEETTTTETVPVETIPEESRIPETAPVETVPEETVTPSNGTVIVKEEIAYNYWSAVVKVEDDGLNVRTEANPFADNIIAKLPSGTSIVVTGDSISTFGDVWFLVVGSGGVKGYVSGRYLLPKYYESRIVEVRNGNTTVYSLPATDNILAACPRISSANSVVTLNEVKQDDGWWSIVKIDNHYVGFVPSKYLKDI